MTANPSRYRESNLPPPSGIDCELQNTTLFVDPSIDGNRNLTPSIVKGSACVYVIEVAEKL